MPGWSEARRAGQSARQSQIKDRAGSVSGPFRVPYKFDSEKRVCFFCGAENVAMVTGWMAITGSIWRCKDKHSKEYDKERKWEADYIR